MNLKLAISISVLGLTLSIGSVTASELGGSATELLALDQKTKTASLGSQPRVAAGSALTGATDIAMRRKRTSPRSSRVLADAPSAAPSHLRKIVSDHAAANGVPAALAHAVVMVESRYNPRVSNGGALGLMQIKPQTARGEGFSGPASALYDAETNIRYGMRYLGAAYRKAGGDVCTTVKYYQSGLYARGGISGANRAYCGKARNFMAQVGDAPLTDG